jgi:hypothetical protein
MIALAASAVVHDGRAAVLVADAAQALRHAGDRRVPIDLLVAAVAAAAERRRETMRVVLIVVEAHRLVAGVALRGRMSLVAPDADEMSVLHLDLDAAVALAEDAAVECQASSVVVGSALLALLVMPVIAAGLLSRCDGRSGRGGR